MPDRTFIKKLSGKLPGPCSNTAGTVSVSAATLYDVVKHYEKGGIERPSRSPMVSEQLRLLQPHVCELKEQA